MTAEQQLERSVLEGKDRDELSAIAQAMSLKTTSRTKKADIIDQILDATGVTSGPASGGQSNGDADHDTNGAAKPARRRARSTTSVTAGNGDVTEARGAHRRIRGRSGLRPSRPRPPARRHHRRRTRPPPATPGRPSSSSRPSWPTAPAPRRGRTGRDTGRTSRATGTARTRATRTRQPEPRQPVRRRRGEPARPPPTWPRAAGQGGELQGGGQEQPYSGELVEVEGLLDLRDDGYGFLRTKGYHPSPKDVYVSINQVRRYHLRKGDMHRRRLPPGGARTRSTRRCCASTPSRASTPRRRDCARASRTSRRSSPTRS